MLVDCIQHRRGSRASLYTEAIDQVKILSTPQPSNISGMPFFCCVIDRCTATSVPNIDRMQWSRRDPTYPVVLVGVLSGEETRHTPRFRQYTRSVMAAGDSFGLEDIGIPRLIVENHLHCLPIIRGRGVMYCPRTLEDVLVDVGVRPTALGKVRKI